MRSLEVIQNCVVATNLSIERAREVFTSLTSIQINWKINPDSWSAAECLSHLVNSNGLYIEMFRTIVDSSPATKEKDFSYSQSFPGKFITKGVDPSNQRKTKTFKPFFPDSSNIDKNILEKFVETSRELISLVEKMKHLDLRKIKLSSPVNILIRMNLGDPLIFIPKHDVRHLNQAERVKNHEAFPH